MEDNKTQSLFTQEIKDMPEKKGNYVRCMGCMEEFSEEYDLCPKCGYVEGSSPKMKTYLRPGTRLADKYMLGKVIGQGGFGITYIGWDEKENRKVAVKEFFPSALSTREEGETQVICYSGKAEQHFKEGVKKMLDEGGRLSKFKDNPNIVNVYDYFEENSTTYIIMEYLEGKNLKDYAAEKGGRIEPREALGMMMPIIGALEEMHKENMIHRDIAPDNIYLCDDGKIKLLDFGSARIAVQDAEKSLSVMVKPGYAPKEQYASRSKQGPWTDVYSVCATLYKLITGESPVESIERETTPLKTLESFGLKGYEDLEKILFKGLEPEPENRIRTALALRNLFMNILTKQAPAAAPVAPPAAPVAPVMQPAANPAQPKKKKGGKIAAIIISVVAGLMLLGGLFFGLILLAIAMFGGGNSEKTTLYSGYNSMYYDSDKEMEYTYYVEESGTYIFESENDSDGYDLTAELYRGDEYLAENDDSVGTDFRIAYYLEAGDTVTLVVDNYENYNEISYVDINVKLVTFDLSVGSNAMYFGEGYYEYVEYTFVPETSGYYSFESANPDEDFKATLYCDGEEIASNDINPETGDENFKIISYCNEGAEYVLEVMSYNDYMTETLNIEVAELSEEYVVAIKLYDIFCEGGCYIDDEDDIYKYTPSTSSTSVNFAESAERIPTGYEFKDNTLWMKFDIRNDQEGYYDGWYALYISDDVINAYYDFLEYKENGIYLEPTDRLYYVTEIQDSYAYFLESGTVYPVTFTVRNGVVWLGFEMDHNERGDIVVWYPF